MPKKPAKRKTVSAKREAARTKAAKRKTKTPKKRKTVDFNVFYEIAKSTGPIRVLDASISCPDGTMSHAQSSSFKADGIITVDLPDGGKETFLIFMTDAFNFGLGVGLQHTATPTGFSFSGSTPVCSADWVCTNGQKRICEVSVTGEVNTSSQPHELNYTYTMLVYCGNDLSCIEKGTFKGSRQKADVGTGLVGTFNGTQMWTLDCCSSREKIPVPTS
jgi:hypothetical protein